MRYPSMLTNPQFSSPFYPQPLAQHLPNEQYQLQPSTNIRNAPSEQQEQQIKTPKSKRSYKLSKINPQSMSPSKTKERKLSKNLVEKQKNMNQLFGHWNVEENKRYHWFLEVHFSHFMNRSMRRMDRIFTLMAKFVSTREAEQCRSHHQKMEKKHKTFAKILLNLRLSHYETASQQPMLKDMEQNEVDLIQPLLTHQALIQNSDNTSMMLTPKSSISSPQKRQQLIEPNMVEMGRIQFDQNEEINGIQNEEIKGMDQEKEEKQEKYLDIEPLINNAEMWGLQLQSSKNYFYKLELMHPDKNIQQKNLLDPDYDNNLEIHNFLFP